MSVVYSDGVIGRLRREQRDNCHKALERTREAREKQLMYTKLKPLSPTKMSGNGSGEPAMTTTGKRTGDVRQSRAVGVAEETRASIDSFEARLKSIPVNTVHQSPPHLATAPATTSSNVSRQVCIIVETIVCLYTVIW